MKAQRLKLAVVANEFFSPEIGRTGGFGWAARRVAECFASRPELGVDVVLISGERTAAPDRSETAVHGTRLLLRQRGLRATRRALAKERIDLLLCIDYRPGYRLALYALPRTPAVIWARDPRTPEDVARVRTVRIPGAEDVEPQGVGPIDCTSLALVARLSKLWARPVLLASKMAHMAGKLPSTYGVASVLVLPNPDVLDYESVTPVKSARPRVVFLARLDPYKRPWLFVELARRFPDVEFLMMGRSHFTGAGAWEPRDLPGNLTWIAHVDGRAKVDALSSAWVLVNTSIHEESPVSMLEALACRTPVLSCVDSGDIVTRFGIFTGRHDGTGLRALPALTEGLERLLNHRELRTRLGRTGQQWVMNEHSTTRFISAFDQLCGLAGVQRPASATAVPHADHASTPALREADARVAAHAIRNR